MRLTLNVENLLVLQVELNRLSTHGGGTNAVEISRERKVAPRLAPARRYLPTFRASRCAFRCQRMRMSPHFSHPKAFDTIQTPHLAYQHSARPSFCPRRGRDLQRNWVGINRHVFVVRRSREKRRLPTRQRTDVFESADSIFLTTLALTTLALTTIALTTIARRKLQPRQVGREFFHRVSFRLHIHRDAPLSRAQKAPPKCILVPFYSSRVKIGVSPMFN